MGENLKKIWGESKSQGDESRWALHYAKLLYNILSEQSKGDATVSNGTSIDVGISYYSTIFYVTVGHRAASNFRYGSLHNT